MIHSCSYKPRPRFFRSDEERSNGRDLFAGVELEIEFPTYGDLMEFDRITEAENLQERIYLKSDGSLSSNGVEIVSFPMTLIEHQNYGWERIPAREFAYLSESAKDGCTDILMEFVDERILGPATV